MRQIIGIVLLYLFALVITIIAAILSSRDTRQADDGSSNTDGGSGSSNGSNNNTGLPGTIPGTNLQPRKITLPNGLTITLFLPPVSSPLLRMDMSQAFFLRNGSNGNYLTLDSSGRPTVNTKDDSTTAWRWKNGALVTSDGRTTLYSTDGVKIGTKLVDDQSNLIREDGTVWRMKPLKLEEGLVSQYPREQTPFVLSRVSDGRLMANANERPVLIDSVVNSDVVWWMEPTVEEKRPQIVS